mgnify:FL=1
MKNQYSNQSKQHTDDELANTAAKRVDIVKIQMVKDKSLLYKYRAISCPNDGYQLMRQFLGDVDREYLIVLCLITKHEPTNINFCHIGSINSSIAHPREIFKTAILSNSARIMVGHTHPSGNPEPSEADLVMTARLTEAGEILGIDVLDHIILGDDDFVSLKTGGYM